MSKPEEDVRKDLQTSGFTEMTTDQVKWQISIHTDISFMIMFHFLFLLRGLCLLGS